MTYQHPNYNHTMMKSQDISLLNHNIDGLYHCHPDPNNIISQSSSSMISTVYNDRNINTGAHNMLQLNMNETMDRLQNVNRVYSQTIYIHSQCETK